MARAMDYRNGSSGGNSNDLAKFYHNNYPTNSMSSNVYSNHSNGYPDPGLQPFGSLTMTAPSAPGLAPSVSISNASEFYDYENTFTSSTNSNFGINNLNLTNSNSNSNSRNNTSFNVNNPKKNLPIPPQPPNSNMNSLTKNFNINAPSYIPKNHYNLIAQSDYELLQTDNQKLKIELILKQQIIKNLSEQINKNDKLKSKKLAGIYDGQETIQLPINHLELYSNLFKKLSTKEQELQDVKSRLETLLVSYSITNTNPYYNSTFTKDGAFDEQELTHKILNKLQILQQENQTLLKLISFGNKSSLLIELNMLKQENKQLKEKLSQKENSKNASKI